MNLFFLPSIAALFGLGTTEILVIAALFLLIFGAPLLPRLARGLGDTLREVRGIARSEGPAADSPCRDPHAPEAATRSGSAKESGLGASSL